MKFTKTPSFALKTLDGTVANVAPAKAQGPLNHINGLVC
jgi:hypothetical protein